MLESRLMRSPARPDPKGGKDAWLAAWNHERRVALACLRAETEIEIEDPELELPDEPFATRVDIDGVHLSGDAGPSADAWIAAAAATPWTGVPLCRALPMIEDAVTSAMLDAGYLLATVEARWPDSVPSTLTVDLEAQVGPLHRVGNVDFDQSMVPAAWRIEAAVVRDRMKQALVKGEIASRSRLAAARDDVNLALEPYGLVVEDVAWNAHDRGSEVRVDLRYQLMPLRSGPGSAAGDGQAPTAGR